MPLLDQLSANMIDLSSSSPTCLLGKRVRRNLKQLQSVHDPQLIEDTIMLAREMFALSSGSGEDRVDACVLLASSLRQRSFHHADDSLLDQIINLEREALGLCPEGHPDRSSYCGNVASSLWMRYSRSGDISFLDESIELQHRALSLRPKGHPDRSVSCGNLAASLTSRYERTGEFSLLDEAIDLEREALDLRPEGHPERSLSCENLAGSLARCYERTGNLSLLNEAINLECEALGLRPKEHPDRSSSCGNLAMLLKTRYERTGDLGLLNEAINLEREALGLCPKGHPDRSASCGSLAASLGARYERTGDIDLLDETIDLEREALDLCPEGHPDRSASCGNLAHTLRTRYKRTGDLGLLDEAINLEREALDLRPEGHTKRSASCGNLAFFLWMRCEHTGDFGLLDESINLEREALRLRPEGHPDRSLSCENLAGSLTRRYMRSKDTCFLDEALDLQREALNFRPEGHSDHSASSANLAILLRICYQRTGDVVILHEMFALLHEALTTVHKHEMWRYLADLAWMHLQATSPFYNVNTAIMYLSQSLDNEHDDIRKVVETLADAIDSVWNCEEEGKHIKLINIYQRLVNLLPLVVHPSLGLQPQLQALKGCSHLGSDAFVSATLAGDCSSGLQALELTQSVIWSQSLHRRDPQLKDVPEPLANKLQELLHAIATNSAVEFHHDVFAARNPHDRLHVHSSRMYALMREIRALPGLDRFMLGETFETLCTVASKHPVVVLVGARGCHYALIIAGSSALDRHALLKLDWTDEDANNAPFGNGVARSCRGGEAPGDIQSAVERLSLGKHTPKRSDRLDRSLNALWLKVVKPVVDHLGLRVSSMKHNSVGCMLINAICITWPGQNPLALVSYRCIQLFTIARSRYLRWSTPSQLC
jgi:tetratricopeptide (TPR) repeat protein